MALAEQTIDQEIADDWKAIQDKYAVEEPEQKEPEPVAVATEEAPEEKAGDTRARDEAGRFAKPDKASQKVEKAKVEAEAKPETAEEPKTDPAPKLETETERDINRAPSTWKPQIRNEWTNLSPTVRAEIHRREADALKGQAELLPDARFGSELRKAIEPYRMLVDSNMGGPTRAISTLLQTASALAMGSPQQKLQTIVGIARDFGVDLSPLGSAPQQQQAQLQSFSDPRVDQLLTQMQQQEQMRQTEAQKQIEMSANAWLNEVDAQGNPKRPYVQDVITELPAMIAQIKQANPHWTHAQMLDAAYERAVWANPDTRAALQDKQRTELEAKQQAENQTRVANAKRAASVNVPRRGFVPSPAKPGSMEETLASTARELGLLS